ncbi:MAG: serine hydrolase domain-containing protein, partial [Thermoanaerobaculia bacterium]
MRSRRRSKALVLLVAAAAGFFLVGAPSRLSADAIDDYLAREMKLRRIPGLSVAIARDGVVVRESSYGLANAETGTPVDADSVFAIASLDKQITAAGVLKAAELEKLGLDDAVSKWVDVELPGATLRQLLSHLSGLPDDTVDSIDGRFFTDYSTEQLLARAKSLVPIAPPGRRFLYSDTGLFLAQLATEKAAGVPWWDFMRSGIFAPAGMKTAISLRPALLLPHRVSAYTLDGDGTLIRDRRLDLDYGPLYCDLGMTTADFARFLAAQDGSQVLSPRDVGVLTTPSRLADGTPAGEIFQWSRYGLGVGLDDFLGEPVTLHSGHSGVGFARFPVRKLSIVVFTNLEHPAGSDPVGLALGIAGLLEPTLAVATLPAQTTASAPSRALLERLRSGYEEFLAGNPDLARYAPAIASVVWEGAPGLAGRLPRLGGLETFELVRDTPLDGARTLLVRARHANGTIYWRVSLDDAGEKIN